MLCGSSTLGNVINQKHHIKHQSYSYYYYYLFPMLFDSPSSPTSMATTNSLRKGKEYYENRHLDVKSTHLHGPCYYWHLHIKLLLHCIILLLLLSHTYSDKKPDGEVKALFDIMSALNDTNGRLADWNYFLVSPCFSWSHVICNHKDGNVISLSLGSLGLSGTISSSINELKFLTSLELQDNNISGELPDLSNLVNLQNLNVTRNKFSGSIPTSWDQLSNLKYLDLSSNNLSGKIPEKLFSASIYNFTGTSLDCGTSLHQPCVSSSSVSGSPNKSKLKFVTISASSGALLLLLFRAIFNESNVIGRGGFRKVYKRVIADNTKVSIKRLRL